MTINKLTRQQIKDKLKLLPENELRKLLCEYFNYKKFYEVIESHGTVEFGKDIVFYDIDKFYKSKWYACVVKAKDINQTVYNDVSRQVNECFKKKYPSHKNGLVIINEVIVITNGVYKDNTKALIAEEIGEKNSPKVEYWDIGDIAEKIEDTSVLDILTNKNSIIQNLLNKDTLIEISNDNNLKFLETDFEVNIGKIEDFQIKIRAKSQEFENEMDIYLKSLDLSRGVKPIKFLPKIEDLIKFKKPVILHGIATSGKTTILKKIGKDFISLNEKGYVFYFELTKVKEDLATSTIENLLKRKFESIINEPFVLDKLEKGLTILLLLDGLDEIADLELENKITNEIIFLSKKIKIVLSSRTNDKIKEDEILKHEFEIYELLPLSFDEMIELGSKVLNDDKKASFIKLVKKNEIINSFPKTPLTTILLAVLFKEDKINVKELPRNITELYSKFIDIFLNKWDQNKGISQQFKFKEKQFILQKIAQHLQENNIINIAEDDMIHLIETILDNHPIQGFSNPSEFLSYICSRSNILLKNSTDNTYRFFHLTMQEYLTASLFNNEDENCLVRNFYDSWWVNTNIFYAGKIPHKSNVLLSIVDDKINIPITEDSKYSFIVHGTKVLQASHLLDKQKRKNILKSMIKNFDDLVKYNVNDFVNDQNIKIKRRTILDMILWERRMFKEFFDSTQFISCLEEIQKEFLLIEDLPLTDITEYCIAYCIATSKKDSTPLYEFLVGRKDVNPRWFKIIDVDVNIKKLLIDDKKLVMKFRTKANKHKEYIQKQFKEMLLKHYSSITSLK